MRNSIYGFAAAAMAMASSALFHPEGLFPGADDMVPGRLISPTRGRPHHDTRGMRAHRVYKTARRTGRHDWRKTLNKRKHG